MGRLPDPAGRPGQVARPGSLVLRSETLEERGEVCEPHTSSAPPSILLRRSWLGENDPRPGYPFCPPRYAESLDSLTPRSMNCGLEDTLSFEGVACEFLEGVHVAHGSPPSAVYWSSV